MSMQLARSSSLEAERAVLTVLNPRADDCYIDGYSATAGLGTFTYLDFSPIPYTNWRGGEPSTSGSRTHLRTTDLNDTQPGTWRATAPSDTNLAIYMTNVKP